MYVGHPHSKFAHFCLRSNDDAGDKMADTVSNSDNNNNNNNNNTTTNLLPPALKQSIASALPSSVTFIDGNSNIGIPQTAALAIGGTTTADQPKPAKPVQQPPVPGVIAAPATATTAPAAVVAPPASTTKTAISGTSALATSSPSSPGFSRFSADAPEFRARSSNPISPPLGANPSNAQLVPTASVVTAAMPSAVPPYNPLPFNTVPQSAPLTASQQLQVQLQHLYHQQQLLQQNLMFQQQFLSQTAFPHMQSPQNPLSPEHPQIQSQPSPATVQLLPHLQPTNQRMPLQQPTPPVLQPHSAVNNNNSFRAEPGLNSDLECLCRAPDGSELVHFQRTLGGLSPFSVETTNDESLLIKIPLFNVKPKITHQVDYLQNIDLLCIRLHLHLHLCRDR
jgi:hypothetical protein